MREALREAQAALAAGEIPIGAVIVSRGRVIGRGHNMTERLIDTTAHAEMVAITAATEAIGGKYLTVRRRPELGPGGPHRVRGHRPAPRLHPLLPFPPPPAHPGHGRRPG